MKKNFTTLLAGLGMYGAGIAQTLVTGPSTSQTPFLNPMVPGYTVTSLLTHSDAIGGYVMCGLPDGLGAFDNGNGSFTVLMNHEMGATVGAVHAHGSAGTFVSKWVINKTTLAVQSGGDLIQTLNLWNPSNSTYSVYNSTNPSTLSAMARFCSGDLPAVTAYYNSATGRGTQERIFMNGEESGNEGRMFAHIATGASSGQSYELPFLGKYSCENLVASPHRSDRTIVIGMDDSTPGQVYVYVGNKTNTGNDIARAGLTGGILYGVAVNGMVAEASASVPAANTTFSLIALSNVQAITGASLNTQSNNVGVTTFLRPEDGAWDPSSPRDFYFVTTNAFNSPSRMWRLRFNDIENPHLGGTITAVLDGTEGQQMLDNMGIDNSGHILIQEDVGNQSHNGKTWEYTIATDAFVQILQHDPNRFVTGGSNFLTQDEEASGMIDVQSILGPGKWLMVDQAHYSVPSPVVEGGQLLLLSSLNTSTSNPEVNVQGNSVSIPAGNAVPATADNTDFGALNTGANISKTFVIQNTGTGPLVISNINFTGSNAGDFSLVSPPSFPMTIAAGGSQTITAKYAPVLVGTSVATLNVYNNDFSESIYDFAVKGTGAAPEINLAGNNVNIVDGNTATSASDNTNFGSIIYNTSVSKTFVIQNTGNGTLTVSGISITGANASEFTLLNAPSLPLTLAGNANQTITIQFLPTAIATRSAMVNIDNTDANEATYDFVISGTGVADVGIATYEASASMISVYPNPVKDEATVKVTLVENAKVAVSIQDIQGRVVLRLAEKELQKGENKMLLNTSALANGEYFVTVKSAGKTSTSKLVVAH